MLIQVPFPPANKPFWEWARFAAADRVDGDRRVGDLHRGRRVKRCGGEKCIPRTKLKKVPAASVHGRHTSMQGGSSSPCPCQPGGRDVVRQPTPHQTSSLAPTAGSVSGRPDSLGLASRGTRDPEHSPTAVYSCRRHRHVLGHPETPASPPPFPHTGQFGKRQPCFSCAPRRFTMLPP